MNREERFICNQQKELYEYAHEKHADMLKFSDAFMNSSFCNRSLDRPYSVDQFADIMNWLEFLEEDCRVEPDLLNNNRISYNTAGWLGFVYRQLHFVTNQPSSELARLVPVARLTASYPGLHTVDEDMAADIIIHDFEVPLITPG